MLAILTNKTAKIFLSEESLIWRREEDIAQILIICYPRFLTLTVIE